MNQVSTELLKIAGRLERAGMDDLASRLVALAEKVSEKGLMPVNKYKAYSFNKVTAKKGKDGSITIHFGGAPKADNFLPIVPGWNYIVRPYRPKQEVLDGSWKFPEPVEAK